MGKEKNLYIETLRGLAILLVVIGHVIGSTPDGGMKIAYPSPFRYLYLFIDFIQMPLFTAIAGFVYAYRPVGLEYLKKFTVKKVYRLLIPMITVGTLYFLMQYFTPGTNKKGVLSDIWQIYVLPYTIYWYLPSLFLIFMAIALIDVNNFAKTVKGALICLLVSIVLMYVEETKLIPDGVPNVLSFKGALLQLPYFIIGVMVCRFRSDGIPKSINAVAWILAVVAIVAIQVEWFKPGTHDAIRNLICPLLVMPVLLLLLQSKWQNKFFVYIGAFAYSIYLFHVFFTGGVRILLVRVGITAQIPVFCGALIIATILPILAEILISKSKILSVLLLGKTPKVTQK